MRNRIFSLPAGLLLASIVLLMLQNCVKDTCKKYYTMWEPVYKTASEARANIKSNAPRNIERPGKIYIRGNYIFLNELDRGIHIIDNSDPSAPRNIAFIDIPGNMDLAVKGDILYADFYSDLVAIDISNPQNVVVKKFTESIFPERIWNRTFRPDSGMIVTDWVKRETNVAVECGGNTMPFGGARDKEMIFTAAQLYSGPTATAAPSSPFGMGGSMASFAIVNDHLYAVSQTSLNVVSINNPTDPVYLNRVSIGTTIETIYPFNNRLFIGSNTGVFIYDVTNPVSPAKLGSFAHIRVCDPVIADSNTAFATLRSGTDCTGATNELNVLDISTITSPVLKGVYGMVNPHGLSKDGNSLIVCDGVAGLRFYDAANVNNLVLQKTINGLEAYDVIALNGWALVVARDGLYQYDFSSINNVHLLSKLGIQ